MRFPDPLRRGRLIKRYKRFLADVRFDDGEEVTAHCPNPGSMLSVSDPGAAERPVAAIDDAGAASWHKMEATWFHFAGPLVDLAGREGSVPARLAAGVLCLWRIAVWGLVGGAITRIAAVGLTCEERVGMFEALRFARTKWLSLTAAPLLPVLGVVLLSLLLAVA